MKITGSKKQDRDQPDPDVQSPIRVAERFIIEEPERDLLGQGGMGTVYRGTDTETGRPVAIKVLKPELITRRPEMLKRFMREGETLRRLNHPNIVKLLAATERDGQHYLVMEYVEGGSLRDLLDAKGHLPLEQSLKIGLDLADALTRAHHLKIVHRDLKPANVLLARDGTPRLADFGIARLSDSPSLTETGLILGTVDYLSPEACQGELLNTRSDIWALGVILYEMLVGQRPFGGESATTTLSAILTQPVPDLRQTRSDIPEPVSHLIERMLAKEPQQRVSSVRLVGAELEAILEGTAITLRQAQKLESANDVPGAPLPHLPPEFDDTARLTHLPLQTTPFIGREKELADITRLLSDPACALLTLVGPGGIGKTRLSLQAAGAMAGNFEQGVYFVPLQSVTSQDFLVSAIADALDFSLSGHAPPDVQLGNYLGNKQILLVLDNFEQLLTPPDEGVMKEEEILLAGLLATAPSVKLLVTSREVLNLQEEWLYPVPGLPVPTGAGQDDLESYDAVSLFVERARRVRREFSPDQEQAEIVQICRLVEGMPLAIELAAAWTKTLSCAAIVAELQRNLDFLTTTLRNVPARHRSMQAVFNNSWQRLTETEQAVFKRLSLFRGGFQREAAEQVAGATLPVLTALVDKSLLQVGANDRYQVHELLRQYAEERLRASPEDAVNVQEAHCAYYADFLQTRQEAMGASSEQQNTTRELRGDWENIRGAWQWAVDQKKVPEIYKAGDTFYNFCQAQSRYREGEAALEKAIRVLEQVEPDELQGKTLAGLLVGHGWLCIRLGMFEKAEAGLKQSWALYQQLDLQPPPYSSASDPLGPLSILATIRGDYDEALRLGHESRRRCETHNDRKNLEYAFYALTSAAFAKGDVESARNFAEQAYATSVEIDDRWTMAYIVSDLGNIARVQGDYAQAKQHYQTSYSLREEMDDPEGMAAALNHLGELAWLQQDFQEAGQLYHQSLALYRDIGDQGGLATTFKGLGQTACALGQVQVAQQHFQEALQISTRIEFVPLTLAILIGIGELLLQTGGLERGVELMTVTLDHPAGDQETKDKTQALLKQYQAKLPPDRFGEAQRRAQAGGLDSAIAALQAALSDPGGLAGASIPAPSQLAHQANQALLDPLSERELEVLQQIAAGLKNREIAGELVVTLSTVKAHINSIYRKLEVNSRVQAVSRARELNLLP